MKLFLLSLVAMMLVSACTFGNVNIERNADGTLNIQVALTESDVTSILQNATQAAGNRFVENVTADLQNGQIVLNGDYLQNDGTRVPGNITLQAGVTDGVPTVTVTSVNVSGFAADDTRIQELNQRIAAALGSRGVRDNANGKITAISITDTALTITLTVLGR